MTVNCSTVRSHVTWPLACALVLVVFVFAGQSAHSAEKLVRFDTPEQEALYQSLLEEYRCLKCQNQNLAGSNADLAADLKREIQQQVIDGKSKADIDEYLVARYGEFVLYRPRFSAVTALLWVGPFVLLAGGVTGIVVMIRRNARREADAVSDDAQAGVGKQGLISRAQLEEAKKLLE